jgi:hypothetical protein
MQDTTSIDTLLALLPEIERDARGAIVNGSHKRPSINSIDSRRRLPARRDDRVIFGWLEWPCRVRILGVGAIEATVRIRRICTAALMRPASDASQGIHCVRSLAWFTRWIGL